MTFVVWLMFTILRDIFYRIRHHLMPPSVCDQVAKLILSAFYLITGLQEQALLAASQQNTDTGGRWQHVNYH